MIRTFEQAIIERFAAHSRVPVINGLTRRAHPCQVMADVMTFEEHRGTIKGAKVAWVGDSNNVLASWVNAAELFGAELNIAVPEDYWPEKDLLADIKQAGAAVNLMEDPQEAVRGADLVIADTWVSMGDTDVAERRRVLKPYQVNPSLMGLADKDALFMHCLPAHRGDEVTDEVIDGPQSVVFDEAENRLHAQKAILCWCLERDRQNL
jgi:ornithine carbamoyltransferase